MIAISSSVTAGAGFLFQYETLPPFFLAKASLTRLSISPGWRMPLRVRAENYTPIRNASQIEGGQVARVVTGGGPALPAQRANQIPP
jgi:hypothetical protein